MLIEELPVDARVVYVDHDPVVLTHARDMLHGVSGTASVDGDLCAPEAILADPDLTASSTSASR